MDRAEVVSRGPVGAGALLAMIRAQPSTRGELLQRTGLARSTLALRLDVLDGLGLITTDSSASTGGRPAAMLRFNPAAGVVAVANVGHTRCHFAVADLAGQTLAESDADVDLSTGPSAVVTWLAEQWDTLLGQTEHQRSDIRACGVSVPGPVDFPTGKMVRPLGLPDWDEFPLADAIRAQVGTPALVDNDVNVMALGEQASNWPFERDIVFVRMGTGIGAGIISDGRVVRGARGAGGAIAHTQVGDRDEPVCACGNSGCLGAIASGLALAQRLSDQGIATSGAHQVAQHVRAGVPEAVAIVRDAGRATGQVLSGIVNTLNPSLVVVGGSLADAGQHLLAGIREEIYGRAAALATEELRIVVARDSRRAGIVGASTMALERLLDPVAIDHALSQHDGEGHAVGV